MLILKQQTTINTLHLRDKVYKHVMNFKGFFKVTESMPTTFAP